MPDYEYPLQYPLDCPNNPTNKYQLKKLKYFFNELQSGLYVTSFKDRYYRSLVIIPQVEFEICPRQKYLMADVWIVEDLFYYQHPFILPDLFRQKTYSKVSF